MKIHKLHFVLRTLHPSSVILNLFRNPQNVITFLTLTNYLQNAGCFVELSPAVLFTCPDSNKTGTVSYNVYCKRTAIICVVTFTFSHKIKPFWKYVWSGCSLFTCNVREGIEGKRNSTGIKLKG